MLRDECEAYGRKLIEAGVETVIARYNGTIPAPDKLSCGSELLESLLEEYRRGKHEVNRCTGPPVISETVLTLWGRTPELAASTYRMPAAVSSEPQPSTWAVQQTPQFVNAYCRSIDPLLFFVVLLA